jgi:hypothetical protein
MNRRIPLQSYDVVLDVEGLPVPQALRATGNTLAAAIWAAKLRASIEWPERTLRVAAISPVP